jgi:hypothetical protein
MAKVLDAVQRFRKIEEATAPKDDPAPGKRFWHHSRALSHRAVADSHALAVYLLDEIAELSRQSPESAQNIADAVEKKLANKSPIVKFKVRVQLTPSSEHTRRPGFCLHCNGMCRRCVSSSTCA